MSIVFLEWRMPAAVRLVSARKNIAGSVLLALTLTGTSADALIAQAATRAAPENPAASGTRQPGTTRVMVRVIARDAKLIGSGVGGALVTITEVANGRVLAQGRHEGGTGDTRLIMTEAHARGTTRFDTPGAAGFLADIAIDRPTVVEIAAAGPGAPDHAAMRATKTLLLIPGRDILGDGILLELHGFRVELIDPAAPAPEPGRPLDITAKITLMCGCPTEPGGTWDSDRFDILARLLDGDRTVAETPLTFTGTTSHFAGRLVPPGPGPYRLEILASDPTNANFGLATRTIPAR